MTILEAIRQADQVRPNDVDAYTKLGWLSKLDGQIAREVHQTHVGTELETLPRYDGTTDAATQELLVPEPWDELYVQFLCMRIDLVQQETELYKDDGELFGSIYQSWLNDYNRNHTPKGVPFIRF